MRSADTSPLIRRGRQDEAIDLAKLHVDVWRATYGDLAPKEAIELLDQAKRLPYWTAATAETNPGRGKKKNEFYSRSQLCTTVHYSLAYERLR